MDIFLNRYNPNRSNIVALSKSISAAVKHNQLYNTSDNFTRNTIRCEWSKRLEFIAESHRTLSLNQDQYLELLVNLKTYMNDVFGDFINFRISHAQKSISVYMKHLWCMNQVPTPIQCPVDRIILTRIGAPYNDRSWGYVDSINEHMRKYDLIRNFAIKQGYNKVSQWELITFN